MISVYTFLCNGSIRLKHLHYSRSLRRPHAPVTSLTSSSDLLHFRQAPATKNQTVQIKLGDHVVIQINTHRTYGWNTNKLSTFSKVIREPYFTHFSLLHLEFEGSFYRKLLKSLMWWGQTAAQTHICDPSKSAAAAAAALILTTTSVWSCQKEAARMQTGQGEFPQPSCTSGRSCCAQASFTPQQPHSFLSLKNTHSSHALFAFQNHHPAAPPACWTSFSDR